jgi:DNA-binding NtrC family response regulator
MRQPLIGDLDSTTLPPAAGAEPSGSIPGVTLIGLVVLWSRSEPDRIGEALLLSPDDAEPWTFGRGERRPRDGGRRIFLARQRPGAVSNAGPIACPRISRAQLRLSPAPGGGALAVTNIGSCAMLRDGKETGRCDLAPGDLLALRNEMLFLCVRRTLAVPSAGGGALPLHSFGEADAFGIVGESQAAWDLRLRVATVARQGFHTLILGESGCGKELVAQAIHAQSSRGGRPMVSRNAATIPEGLADAELFGNVRNYPNAGMPDRPGLVGQAHGSTLFLDEFADLPAGVQTRLLRVMDDGEYHRLGEATARRSDLRMLAATNRPASHIKHDVLARLKVRVQVPDLNVRREDIPLMAAHLLRRHAKSNQPFATRLFRDGDPRGALSISPVFVEALVKHRYTANVRELDALLIHSAIDGDGHYVEPSPDPDREADRETPPRAPLVPVVNIQGMSPIEQIRLGLLRRHAFSPGRCGRDPDYPGNRQTADLHLRQLLCRALHLSDWDTRRAAALLAGSANSDLHDKAAVRIEKFLSNLGARAAGEPDQRLRQALIAEWKGNAESVLNVLEALRAGKVNGAPPQRRIT